MMEEREKQRNRPVVALVEDDAAIATMYQYALESAGFDVTVYCDPETFLDSLRDHLPDVVVLDWQLSSHLTGGDVLQALRREAGTARLPVFFLSNQVFQPEDAFVHSLKSGSVAWLAKSRTTTTDLATRLARAVDS